MKLAFLFLIILVLKLADGFQGVFWHICDVHLNLSYKSFGASKYGDYRSDSPLTLIESAFQEMIRIYPNPDFIILNGDNVYHEISKGSEFLISMKTVSNEISKRFPNTTIIPSFGNHDIYPANLYNVKSEWCNTLFSYWKQFFTNANASEIETFKTGCYYSRRIKSKGETVNIIVLNTMLWYSVNSLVKDVFDPLGQFLWLQQELSKSRKENIKVFFVGHVPPGASEYSPNTYRHLHPEFNIKLLKIMQEFSDIIDAGFFSHQHTDAFKIVYDRNNNPVVPLFLSPSVTPYYLSELGSVNPSVRLYFWNDKVTQSRYEQYHTKLNRSLHWSLEYNSTSLLPGLSAVHLNDLLSEFMKEDSTHFDKFFYYHLSGQPHDNKDCSFNSSCRCNIFCGIQNIDYTQLDSCLKKCPHKSISQWIMIASVIIIFTIILIGVVIGANKVYCRGRRTASLTRDIYLAPYNGKNCEEIMSEHIDNIAESTFGDVPEYRGHIRNNSRTILTLNDGNEIVEKSQPSISKFVLQSKSKSQEKYDYTRM